MKYYFIDPFTGNPISTPEEFREFLDDHPEIVITQSAAEINKARLERIAQLKAQKRKRTPGKPD